MTFTRSLTQSRTPTQQRAPDPPADVSWEQLGRLLPEAAVKVLRDGCITPAVAKRLVDELGYRHPDDLKHMTVPMVSALALPPLQDMKVKKLIGLPVVTARPEGKTNEAEVEAEAEDKGKEGEDKDKAEQGAGDDEGGDGGGGEVDDGGDTGDGY